MKERYIERVLRALPRARRAGVRRDLEEIFADSQARGESEAQVLERLGPPEAFARGVAPGARRGAGAVWFFVCAAAAVLALGAAALAAVLRRRIPKQLRLPGLLYGLLLASLGSAAFIALRAGAPGGAYLLAGGCLFLCSDGILSFETFRDGDSNAADVAVMLTYIAAQTLLAIGFSMG